MGTVEANSEKIMRVVTDRLDWTIKQGSSWIATHVSGKVLVARTKSELMGKINAFECSV
jgi:hypothetical protein